MIDKDACLGVVKGLRNRRRANCRRAARILYQARQLGKAAEFIWRHRRDADPDEVVGMRVATRGQSKELRRVMQVPSVKTEPAAFLNFFLAAMG